MIDKFIGDLLLRHNCVIVPGFGGFVAKQTSAKIDYDSGKMFPPSKSLLFNKQLINNDGLLINTVATESNIEYTAAETIVADQTKLWHSILQNDGRIELDRIGFLFLDAEKNLCFEQDRFFNLLTQSYGLGEIHFLSEEDVMIADHMAKVKSTKLEPVKETVSETPPLVEINQQAESLEHVSNNEAEVVEVEKLETPIKKLKIWKYVAAACMIPIAFYSVWLPVKTDVLESGLISVKDFNPFYEKQEAQYTPSEIQSVDFSVIKEEHIEEQTKDLKLESNVFSYKLDDDSYINVDVSDDNEQFIQSTEINNEELVETKIVTHNVHFIVGCFGDKSNADNLLVLLKQNGLSSAIQVDFHNGLYRISAGGAASINGLADIKSSSAAIGLDGWVLRVK